MSENKPIVKDSPKPAGYNGTSIEASGSLEWEKAMHGITWISGSFMLMNVALGPCLLNATDLYDRLGGIWMATLVQIIFILITFSTMYVMCACSDLDDVDTYDEVVDYMCGRIVQKLSTLSIMFTCFGICVMFLIVIGDQTDRIFATFHGPDFCETLFMNRGLIIVFVSLVFVRPMSCATQLARVKYWL